LQIPANPYFSTFGVLDDSPAACDRRDLYREANTKPLYTCIEYGSGKFNLLPHRWIAGIPDTYDRSCPNRTVESFKF